MNENANPDSYSQDPCFEQGHWFINEDGDLYIVPDDRQGIAEIFGPDDDTLDALNSIYREAEKDGDLDWFDAVDIEGICQKLDLTFVHQWQRRFDTGKGWYVV